MAVAVEFNLAVAGDDFHSFRFVGVEVIFTRIDQSERLFAPVRKEDRMAYDASVEIDIGLATAVTPTNCSGTFDIGLSSLWKSAWKSRIGKGSRRFGVTV